MVEAFLATFESVVVREVREGDVQAEEDGEGDDGGADAKNAQVDVVQDRAQEKPTKSLEPSVVEELNALMTKN